MSRIAHPNTTRRNFVRHVFTALALAGVLLALYPVAQNLYTFWNQQTLKNQLAATQKSRLVSTSSTRSSTRSSPSINTTNAKQSATTVKNAARAWPLTRIASPEIGLDAVVVSGQNEDDLRRGPGHDPHTAFPGERGNCVIAAHRNVYGSHFRRVDELLPGSIITLQTPDASYRYSVIQIYTVSDTDTHIRRPPTDPNSPPILTLFTCTIPRTAARVVVTAQLLTDDAP